MELIYAFVLRVNAILIKILPILMMALIIQLFFPLFMWHFAVCALFVILFMQNRMVAGRERDKRDRRDRKDREDERARRNRDSEDKSSQRGIPQPQNNIRVNSEETGLIN